MFSSYLFPFLLFSGSLYCSVRGSNRSSCYSATFRAWACFRLHSAFRCSFPWPSNYGRDNGSRRKRQRRSYLICANRSDKRYRQWLCLRWWLREYHAGETQDFCGVLQCLLSARTNRARCKERNGGGNNGDSQGNSRPRGRCNEGRVSRDERHLRRIRSEVRGFVASFTIYTPCSRKGSRSGDSSNEQGRRYWDLRNFIPGSRSPGRRWSWGNGGTSSFSQFVPDRSNRRYCYCVGECPRRCILRPVCRPTCSGVSNIRGENGIFYRPISNYFCVFSCICRGSVTF